ncbi:MAG TPA: SGNH/GDSL hydrolase family protein [Ramlibacter sp.]
MPPPSRRGFLGGLSAAILGSSGGGAGAAPPFTLHTFGDSILDCGHYNPQGVHPGQLLVGNDDGLFPDFRGHDLRTRLGGAARLDHRAVDGATVDGLQRQLQGLRRPAGPAVALLTVGGNDLLRGLAADEGAGMREFERTLNAFVRALPVRPLLIGTVYDPTFGDDSRNFLGVDARTARRNHRRVNEILAEVAGRAGSLADLHGHFLKGNAEWYVHTIEPSLRGASEVRRVFLPLVLARA